MYYDNLDSCFYKYLQDRKIIKVDDFETKDISASMAEIEEQTSIINDFHNRMCGYTGRMNKRLGNSLGRHVEQYKVYIRKLSKYIRKIKNKGPETDFEKLICENGMYYVEKAKKCIENIYENNYMCLLKRSMNKNEVCLKNVYLNNLRKVGDTIEVINLNGCAYNMIEMDEINLLRKVKKKLRYEEVETFAAAFCKMSSLDKDSFEFIMSVYSYPVEFMKCWIKYKNNPAKEKKIVRELMKIMKT